MDEYTKIEELLTRFFEGQTTRAEEQELYRVFSQDTLPERLNRYRSVLGWFESGLAEECASTETVTLPVPRRHRMRRWWQAATVAAALVGVAVGIPLLQTALADPYAGSYVVRGGVKVTDMKLIRVEVEATFHRVMRQQEACDLLYKQLDEPLREEQTYLSAEQVVEEQYRHILRQVRDTVARKEVIEILGIESII